MPRHIRLEDEQVVPRIVYCLEKETNKRAVNAAVAENNGDKVSEVIHLPESLLVQVKKLQELRIPSDKWPRGTGKPTLYYYKCPIPGVKRNFASCLHPTHPSINVRAINRLGLPRAWVQHCLGTRTHACQSRLFISRNGLAAGFCHHQDGTPDHCDQRMLVYLSRTQLFTSLAFDCELSPPRDTDMGAVSDRVPWPEPRFNDQVALVRQHVQESHPDFAPRRWPPGFTKQGNVDVVVDDISDVKEEVGSRRSSQVAAFEYTCPVDGCGTTFRVLQAWDPPITIAAKVSDQTPWPLSRMGPTLQAVRGHMQTYHMDVPLECWPPGFPMQTMTQ